MHPASAFLKNILLLSEFYWTFITVTAISKYWRIRECHTSPHTWWEQTFAVFRLPRVVRRDPVVHNMFQAPVLCRTSENYQWTLWSTSQKDTELEKNHPLKWCVGQDYKMPSGNRVRKGIIIGGFHLHRETNNCLCSKVVWILRKVPTSRKKNNTNNTKTKTKKNTEKPHPTWWVGKKTINQN